MHVLCQSHKPNTLTIRQPIPVSIPDNPFPETKGKGDKSENHDAAVIVLLNESFEIMKPFQDKNQCKLYNEALSHNHVYLSRPASGKTASSGKGFPAPNSQKDPGFLPQSLAKWDR